MSLHPHQCLPLHRLCVEITYIFALLCTADWRGNDWIWFVPWKMVELGIYNACELDSNRSTATFGMWSDRVRSSGMMITSIRCSNHFCSLLRYTRIVRGYFGAPTSGVAFSLKFRRSLACSSPLFANNSAANPTT